MITVLESTIRLQFSNSLRSVLLTISNGSAENVNSRIDLKFLNQKNRVVCPVQQELLIKPGRQGVRIDLPCERTSFDREMFPWGRLVYEFLPMEKGTPSYQHGIVSLAGLSPELFEILVASSAAIRDTHSRLQVIARHPVSRKPIHGVRIRVVMPSERIIVHSPLIGFTKDRGYLPVDFEVSAEFEEEEFTIKVTGEIGELRDEAAQEISVLGLTQFQIDLDKPIYQPGQPVHIRVLAKSGGRKVLANARCTLSIQDPEDFNVARTELTTSRFGVAHWDWNLPENLRPVCASFEAREVRSF